MGILADISRGKLVDAGLTDQMARALNLVGPDYDYSKMQGLDRRLHGSDLGKLPNHPTFSDQSYYSGGKGLAGGQWSKMYTPDDRIVQTYTPSEDMIKLGPTQGLARYMQRVEPDVTLQIPKGNWEPR